jgi:hypothetical protein
MAEKLEAVENKQRKRNEAAKYYPVLMEVNGEPVWFMFTHSQLKVAAARADRNPEDIPTVTDSLLGKLINWFK